MITNFGRNRTVLPYRISVPNMKALSLSVQMLWPRIRFFKSRSKVKVEVKMLGINRKVSSQRIHMFNMKALISKVGRSQGQGHEAKMFGTCTNRQVLQQGIHMYNMKALSLLVQKLWPRLFFFQK